MNFTNLKNFMDDMTRKFVPGNVGVNVRATRAARGSSYRSRTI